MIRENDMDCTNINSVTKYGLKNWEFFSGIGDIIMMKKVVYII